MAAQSNEGVEDDPASRFKSIAAGNPYLTPYRFRDSLLPGEPFFFTVHDLERKNSSYSSFAELAGTSAKSPKHLSPKRMASKAQRAPSHRRASSEPGRKLSMASSISPNTALLIKSLSEADKKRMSGMGLSAGLACHSGGKRTSLTPVRTSLTPCKKLSRIEEQGEGQEKRYKVEVIDPDSQERVIRSPKKRLFGDDGLLGKKEDNSPPRKQHIVSQIAGKVKEHVGDLVDNVRSLSLIVSDTLPEAPSTFPVTLSPYSQGDFYMQLELLLTVETNRFILNEFQYGRVSTESVKRIVEAWKNKGRPQVIGFRYDLGTQRDLIVLNIETVHFNGVNAFTRTKLLSVLAAWKALAKEISIRTFCQPDSAVRKHLYDSEKILELIDAAPDSMMAFQEMRAKVVSDIYREERHEREGTSRSGSPVR